jgi:hypothetical protein
VRHKIDFPALESSTITPMRMDDTVLYEQFVEARLKAVELTDFYRSTPADDPRRAVIWETVVRQTELARGLLESWLHSNRPAPELVAVGRHGVKTDC